MILARNTAPEYIFATAIGPSVEYIKKYSNLCKAAEAFPREYELAYGYKNAQTAPDTLEAFREWTKNFIIAGPELDVQTINMYTNKFKRLPQYITTPIYDEVHQSFYIAGDVKYIDNGITTFRTGPIHEDSVFLNILANLLLTCAPPCNYFGESSTAIGFNGAAAQVPSSNTSPLWDTTMSVVHAPLNATVETWNKMSPLFQQQALRMNISTENVFRNGISSFFPEERVAYEKSLMDKGSSIEKALSYSYTTDINSYLIANSVGENIQRRLSTMMGDCYRVYDYNRRYNPMDGDMNMGYARPRRIVINTDGYPAVIPSNGSGGEVPPYTIQSNIEDNDPHNNLSEDADDGSPVPYDNIFAENPVAMYDVNYNEVPPADDAEPDDFIAVTVPNANEGPNDDTGVSSGQINVPLIPNRREEPSRVTINIPPLG